MKLATRNDVKLQAVITAVQTGKWYDISKDPRVNTTYSQPFEKVKEELCTLPDLVLRGHRIVVPESLREKVCDQMVEEKVNSFLACQVTTSRNEREPLQMSELPTAPWTKVGIDFGVALTGSSEYLLIETY